MYNEAVLETLIGWIFFFFFIVVLFPFFLGTLFAQWLSLNLRRLSPLNYKLHMPLVLGETIAAVDFQEIALYSPHG